ncbi:hypothetical protein D3C71_2118700 [compost metagenome]
MSDGGRLQGGEIRVYLEQALAEQLHLGQAMDLGEGPIDAAASELTIEYPYAKRR